MQNYDAARAPHCDAKEITPQHYLHEQLIGLPESM